MIYKVQIGSVAKVYEGTPEEIAALIAKLETIDQQVESGYATLDPNEQSETELSCSFCGEKQSNVKNLVSAQDVYICDTCIVLCSELIEPDNVKGETP